MEPARSTRRLYGNVLEQERINGMGIATSHYKVTAERGFPLISFCRRWAGPSAIRNVSYVRNWVTAENAPKDRPGIPMRFGVCVCVCECAREALLLVNYETLRICSTFTIVCVPFVFITCYGKCIIRKERCKGYTASVCLVSPEHVINLSNFFFFFFVDYSLNYPEWANLLINSHYDLFVSRINCPPVRPLPPPLLLIIIIPTLPSLQSSFSSPFANPANDRSPITIHSSLSLAPINHHLSV